MSKTRVAAYLSVDIGLGEGIAEVNEQLAAFDKRMLKDKNKIVKLYCDVMTDERVADFGDQAVVCADRVLAWATERGIPCKPAITIKQVKA